MPTPIVDLGAVSPDRKWVVVSQALSSGGLTLGQVAHAADSSRAVTLRMYCGVQWSPDGKTLYIGFFTSKAGRVREVALATLPGSLFPTLPPEDVTFETAVKLRSAQALETTIVPSLQPGVFAYQKLVAQRNIYRIPIR